MAVVCIKVLSTVHPRNTPDFLVQFYILGTTVKFPYHARQLLLYPSFVSDPTYIDFFSSLSSDSINWKAFSIEYLGTWGEFQAETSSLVCALKLNAPRLSLTRIQVRDNFFHSAASLHLINESLTKWPCKFLRHFLQHYLTTLQWRNSP